ncbi:tricarboxylate transporter [Magnaporthiopsis poae ATCC 64411]|uniref:Tricarboxylate transporter n=1 Tax=Magnaporthiopsis poae (strain ATCC 64411 / 73-15) TaxID=644358 RepID=A0A0C4DKI3_MAGP6|nr:tricarboxylate transporter [Magnaporthiopsis poae ATCC 64411]
MSTTTAALVAAAPILAPLAKPAPAADVAPAKPKARVSTIVSLISGGTAGAVEAFATYPFEFAKTRGQLLSKAERSANPFSIITTVARQEGLGAIYTGCSTLAAGCTLKAGVRFMSYDTIKNILVDDNGKLTTGRGILAGMFAGAVESVVAVTPTERIKTALIDDARSAAPRFRSGAHALRMILAERGIAGLYSGLASSTLKQSTTSAARMGSYNALRELSKSYGLPNDNTAVTFATGATAGLITVAVTQPFDTIKTRAQSARGASTAEAFMSVLREGGVGGFWAGSTMRLGRLVFSGGIIFTVYEKIAAGLSSRGL